MSNRQKCNCATSVHKLLLNSKPLYVINTLLFNNNEVNYSLCYKTLMTSDKLYNLMQPNLRELSVSSFRYPMKNQLFKT